MDINHLIATFQAVSSGPVLAINHHIATIQAVLVLSYTVDTSINHLIASIQAVLVLS